MGDGHGEGAAGGPGELHPHGQDHLPLAWRERLVTLTTGRHTCAQLRHPDKSHSEVGNGGNAHQPGIMVWSGLVWSGLV